MKPLPKEPDDERRKKSKVAKGVYSMLTVEIHHFSESIFLVHIIYYLVLPSLF